VSHTQNYVLKLERDRLGQLAAELGAVDVAVDGGHRRKLTENVEHGWPAEVAGVDDQVCRSQGGETRLRQKTGCASLRSAHPRITVAARQVGVRDYGEPKAQSVFSSPRSERSRLASMRSR
jgi:hypothetical protein